jgi:hypothetical protein
MRNYQEIEDRELDDLFRKAHTETAVVPQFDQAFWSEMESLLPIQSKKKRIPIYFWFTSIAAVLLISVGVFSWFSMDEKRETSSTSVKHKSNNNLIEKQAEIKDKTVDLDVETTGFESRSKMLLDLTTLLRSAKSDETTTLVHEVCPTDNSNLEALDRDPFLLMRKEIPCANKPVFTLNKFAPYIFTPQNDRYFIQLATGLGSSYQRAVTNRNGLLFTTTLTGGVRTSVRSMELQAGISLRAEFVDNIIWTRNTNSLVNGQNTLGVERFNARQLYSLEFPLALGWNGGLRHNVVAQIVPGIQIAGYGIAQKEQENVVVDERRGVQNMNDSKTMTMELGLAYNYRIGMRHQLGVACNMDVIRPFNTSYYLGQNRHFPINMQFSVRRYFSTGK